MPWTCPFFSLSLTPYLKNHLLCLHSSYFARLLLLFLHTSALPMFPYFYLAPDSLKLILPPGFIILTFPMFWSLLVHSLGFPVLSEMLLFESSSSFLSLVSLGLEAGRNHWEWGDLECEDRVGHVKVCSHLTTPNLHFFPCKGKRCPLAQNSMTLGFLCRHRERQEKIQHAYCTRKMNCNIRTICLAKTRESQVYLMTWNGERWYLELRAAYWLFLKQEQAPGLLDWTKPGQVKTESVALYK